MAYFFCTQSPLYTGHHLSGTHALRLMNGENAAFHLMCDTLYTSEVPLVADLMSSSIFAALSKESSWTNFNSGMYLSPNFGAMLFRINPLDLRNPSKASLIRFLSPNTAI